CPLDSGVAPDPRALRHRRARSEDAAAAQTRCRAAGGSCPDRSAERQRTRRKRMLAIGATGLLRALQQLFEIAAQIEGQRIGSRNGDGLTGARMAAFALRSSSLCEGAKARVREAWRAPLARQLGF